MVGPVPDRVPSVQGRTGTGTGPVPINRKLGGPIRVSVLIPSGPTTSIVVIF
jgi:hypothetical protein